MVIAKGWSTEGRTVGAVPRWLWAVWFVVLTQPLLTPNSFAMLRPMPLLPYALKGEAFGFLMACIFVEVVCRWGTPWIRWRFKPLVLGSGLFALVLCVAGSGVTLAIFGRRFVFAGLLTALSSMALGALALWPGEKASWESRPRLSGASLKPAAAMMIIAAALPTVWLLAVTPSFQGSPGTVNGPLLMSYWIWSLIATISVALMSSSLLSAPSCDNRLILGALVVGLGLYGSAMRVAGTSFWTSLGSPVAPFLIALVLAALLCFSANPDATSPALTGDRLAPSSVPNEQDALLSAVKGLAHQASLSQRETDVLLLLVQGHSSQEIAQQLDLKASTVRTYMGRLSKKAGYDSATQLLSQLHEAVGASIAAEKPAMAKDETSAAELTACRSQADASHGEGHPIVKTPFFWAFAVLLLVLVPCAQKGGAWNYGAPQVFGSAWAFLAFAASLYFGLPQRFVAYWDKWGFRRRLSMVLIAGVLLICSALAVTGESLPFVPAGFWSSGSSRMIVAMAQFILVLTAIAAAFQAKGVGAGRRRLKTFAMLVGAVFIGRLGSVAWTVALCAAVFGLASSIVMTQKILTNDITCEVQGSDKGIATSPCFTLPPLVLGGCGVGVGLIIEEAWRSLGAHNAIGLAVPFAACIMVAAIVLSIRFMVLWGVQAVIVITIAMIAIVLLGIAQNSWVPLIDLALLLIISTMANSETCTAKRVPAFMDSSIEWFYLGVGCGSIAAWHVVSVYGDLSGYNEVASLIFGGQEALRLAVGFGFGLLACLTCACACWVAIAIYNALELRVVEAAYGDRLTQKDRIEAYLKARGLNALQCKVLLGILQNKTGREISRDLGYSLGSINTARNRGYQQLGVHSKTQLIDCIVRGIGL